jgi:hypothetical protein
MLGGMEWAGIPLVAEILGYDDIEILITELATIRDEQRKD